MRGDLLLDSEKGNQGEYAYLNVDVTRANLAMFGERVRFNKGYIPESFAGSENPEAIVWMHIDLNSATPTIAALDFSGRAWYRAGSCYSTITPGPVTKTPAI